MFVENMTADEKKEMLHQLTLLKLMHDVPNAGQRSDIDLITSYAKTFVSLKSALEFVR